MLYRGKRYIVTATFDGHWAWVVILSSRLSARGRAMTKFEAIEQATHLIDRIISIGKQQLLPRTRRERLRGLIFGFLRKWPANPFSRASGSCSEPSAVASVRRNH
jgi:hypothetical protein